jgi:hypothetical protein
MVAQTLRTKLWLCHRFEILVAGLDGGLQLAFNESAVAADFSPRLWGERVYSRLFYWNEAARGGHFAAFEQPAVFVEELRAAFRALPRRG